MPKPSSSTPPIRLYDDETDSLVAADLAPDRVNLLPGEGHAHDTHGAMGNTQRIRILWGQDLFRDVLDGRYRAVICGVNDADNSHGIIAKLVDTVTTSQWTTRSVTSYARMFQESAAIHAARDKEPYVLKYDLDSVIILALLRPRGRDHFTTEDLQRGFATVTKMIQDRRERLPIASVSFLNARANRLLEGSGGAGVPPAAGHGSGREPSFETVLRTMYQSGFRGDVYPSPASWKVGNVGVFPHYPFPAGVTRMREGSS